MCLHLVVVAKTIGHQLPGANRPTFLPCVIVNVSDISNQCVSYPYTYLVLVLTLSFVLCDFLPNITFQCCCCKRDCLLTAELCRPNTQYQTTKLDNVSYLLLVVHLERHSTSLAHTHCTTLQHCPHIHIAAGNPVFLRGDS